MNTLPPISTLRSLTFTYVVSKEQFQGFLCAKVCENESSGLSEQS